VARKTIWVQRQEAEERAEALLRAVVPDKELRWRVERNRFGRIVKRNLTGIVFIGQSGKFEYQIDFGRTSENIRRRNLETGRSGGLCGGPYPWNDYIMPGSNGFAIYNNPGYTEAILEARNQGTQPLHLPNHDIWLGQYLALKYDEQAFLKVANAY
jgi:hypothetical protein